MHVNPLCQQGGASSILISISHAYNIQDYDTFCVSHQFFKEKTWTLTLVQMHVTIMFTVIQDMPIQMHPLNPFLATCIWMYQLTCDYEVSWLLGSTTFGKKVNGVSGLRRPSQALEFSISLSFVCCGYVPGFLLFTFVSLVAWISNTS